MVFVVTELSKSTTMKSVTMRILVMEMVVIMNANWNPFLIANWSPVSAIDMIEMVWLFLFIFYLRKYSFPYGIAKIHCGVIRIHCFSLQKKTLISSNLLLPWWCYLRTFTKWNLFSKNWKGSKMCILLHNCSFVERSIIPKNFFATKVLKSSSKVFQNILFLSLLI